jgi:hypothetical protein
MRTPLRIGVLLLGAFFALQGVGWLAAPERAAAGLAMPLLEGLGRSTQIGDFAAMFLTIGVTALLGARAGHARLLLVPAGVLAAAAVARSLAWALHGADFATTFIAVEALSAALFAYASRRLAAAG